MLTALLVSILLTVAFITVLFLAEVVAGVPMPAFDLFDLISRELPGGLVTFGIDLMVDTIRALNLGPTDTTAKLGEQMMAVLTFGVLAVIAGVIYFAIARRILESGEMTNSLISGVVLGLVIGVPMLIISADINTSATASDAASTIWLLVAFVAWGLAHGFVYNRFAAVQETETEASVRALNRRQFLIQLGATTATITVVGAGLSALLNSGDEEGPPSDVESITGDDGREVVQLPNADDPVEPAPGTRPEYTPLEDHYRIDINSGRPPSVAAEGYTLPINGLVENPTELTLDQITNDFETMDQFITMGCISNRIAGDLISTILWTGVSMQAILELVNPTPEATHIRITGADRFDEVVALDLIREDERIMLAYAWDRQPLPIEHGFPLRIHIPDRYGMKQPKWITGMEFIAEWEEGYWVRRGWDRDAIVKATSVIDTVATDMMIIEDDDSQLVPIGGIAWAGARGISRVEVRVDDGDWVEAELRGPLSDKTWVIWRYNWPFQEGEHTFAVRCYDGDGTQQIEEPSGVRPDGATGIHDVDVNL